MSAALLSSAPLSSISAPSESTRFLLPTHHKRLRLSSLTQHRLSLKLGTSRPLTLRCSSTMHQSSTPSSCSQDSLFYSRAFWVSRSIIAWNVGAGEGECYLYASRNAALCVADGEIQGHDVKIKLERTNYGLSQQLMENVQVLLDCSYLVFLMSYSPIPGPLVLFLILKLSLSTFGHQLLKRCELSFIRVHQRLTQ